LGEEIKLSTIKKPLNRQADKFIGQIFSKGFKSLSILREGFRMGKFKLMGVSQNYSKS